MLRPSAFATVSSGTPLRVVHAKKSLPRARDRAMLLEPGRAGGWWEVQPAQRLTAEETRHRVDERRGGASAQSWSGGQDGRLRYDTTIVRAVDVHHTPEFGAVFDSEGRVFSHSAGGALYVTPDLAELPGVQLNSKGEPVFFAPRTEEMPRASVFMAWGGRFNYGHFMLDCLTSLTALDEADLLEAYPPVAPPLTPWQAESLRLLLGPETPVRVLQERLVSVGEAVFATPMDHYLHAPGSLVRRVGERIRSRVGVPAASPRRIYLSRRGDGKRVMVNEAALEACLEDRGFVVVKPETLGPGDQARLVHDAEVIVSATGAGLTNCLFAPAGCKVFEIQPINFTGIWVWSLCEELEQEWYGYFCPSPIEAHTAVVGGVDYTNVLFSYELPLTDFLGFLDERL